MAEIKQDGVYTIKGQEKDVSIQFRKGHVVPDDVEYVRIGDFTEPGPDTTRERIEAAAKAAAAPENKAAAKPADK
jgi:asparagine synthetase A